MFMFRIYSWSRAGSDNNENHAVLLNQQLHGTCRTKCTYTGILLLLPTLVRALYILCANGMGDRASNDRKTGSER